MKKQMKVNQTVLDFCTAWFEERDLEKTLGFLTEDVRFVGTGLNESAQGREEMREYLRKDLAEIREPFQMEITALHEQFPAENVCAVSAEAALTNSQYIRRRLAFFTLTRTKERWLIFNFHFAEPSGNQKGEERYPHALVLEHAVKQLLNDSIAGGMMGGYMEEGIPFYFANRKMLQYLGYQTEEEIVADIGGLLLNCMHPEDREMVDASIKEQFASGDEYTVEHRMKRKDGEYIWVHNVGREIVAEDGRHAITSVCVDITREKKQREQMRNLYEKELAYFAEVAASDGSLQGMLNVTKNRLEAYQANTDVAIGRVGNSYDETIENLSHSVVDAEYGRRILGDMNRQKVLEDYGAGITNHDFEFLRKSNTGKIFWSKTSFRAAQNPETGDILFFFYTLDITEQTLQGKLFDRITKLDYDVIIDINLQTGQYRLASHSDGWRPTVPSQGNFHAATQQVARRCIDTSRQEFLTKLNLQYMKRRLAEQDSYYFITEIVVKDRGPRVKRFQVFYIDRELGRVCVTQTDVTDVVQKEQKQKEELTAVLAAAEQANAAKSDFLSRMSHEIRTPMNAIIGMSAIAAQHVGNDEQVADCISKIGISSRFLLSLINDILDMSRIESGKMLLKNEKIPMEEFLTGINSICFDQASAKGVEYECILDPVLDDYYIGDAMRLQQVLLNMLSNAIKFTGEGGKVTFSAAQRHSTKNDAVLRFVVNDTGIGMGEDYLPHVFEPFSQESGGTTAMYGGTGLGLAISKNIVDMMDGKITVRSIKGIGTEFTVDVKMGIVEEEKLRHIQKKQNHNFSHLKTLVVDDDVAVCESAVATLREMGVTAEWVDSGRKAVAQVKRLWEKHKNYDMILIDWKMPDMDGLASANNIRHLENADAGSIPIIAMTANAFDDDIEKSKAAGMNAHLAKPINPERLYQTLYDFIFGKEA